MSDHLSLNVNLNSQSQSGNGIENVSPDSLSNSSEMSTEERLLSMETPMTRLLGNSERDQVNKVAQSTTSTQSAPSLNQPPLNITDMGRLLTSPRITPLAVGLTGVEVFEKVTGYYSIESAAKTMGFDLSTVEGAQAARAYVWGSHNSGMISPHVQTNEHRAIAAQAISLYELANPGSLGRAVENNSYSDQKGLTESVNTAIQAYEGSRLTLQEGEMARGWREVFPELTPEEKELTTIPGFTPERIEQLTETYPALDSAEQKSGGKYENPIQEIDLPNRFETPVVQDGVDNKPYMTQESKDGNISGSSNITNEVGYCEAQNIPDQTGKNKEELEETLNDRGFTKKQRGSYDEWTAPDGSKIFVRPNGEIVRQGPKRLNPSDPHNSPRIRDRFDQNGNIIPYNPGGTSHSTGEIVK